MPTRNVVLTDHHERLIEGLVACGRYQNASEVLREGLRMVESREMDNEAKLAALRAAVQVGIDAIDRGEYTDFANFAELAEYMNVLAEEALGPMDIA